MSTRSESWGIDLDVLDHEIGRGACNQELHSSFICLKFPMGMYFYDMMTFSYEFPEINHDDDAELGWCILEV